MSDAPVGIPVTAPLHDRKRAHLYVWKEAHHKGEQVRLGLACNIEEVGYDLNLTFRTLIKGILKVEPNTSISEIHSEVTFL